MATASTIASWTDTGRPVGLEVLDEVVEVLHDERGTVCNVFGVEERVMLRALADAVTDPLVSELLRCQAQEVVGFLKPRVAECIAEFLRNVVVESVLRRINCLRLLGFLWLLRVLLAVAALDGFWRLFFVFAVGFVGGRFRCPPLRDT